MAWRNTIEGYGRIARLLHWGMAVLVIGLLAVGLIMTGMPLNPDKLALYGWHKSIGITVLGLALVRLSWRWLNITPPLPGHTGRAQRLAANGAHCLLYVLLLAMPLSGWLMSSAAGFPVAVYGWFHMPDLVSADKELRLLSNTLHELGAYLFIALISLHIIAALYHHLIYKDSTLTRMLYGRKRD